MDIEQFKATLDDGLKPLERAIDNYRKEIEARRATAEARRSSTYETLDRIEGALGRIHDDARNRIEQFSCDAGAVTTRVMELCCAL